MNSHKRDIALLLATLFVIFIAVEISLRIYYSATGQYIGKTDFERYQKERYHKLMQYNEGSPSRDQYKDTDMYIFDRLLGTVHKPGYSENYDVRIRFNATHDAIVEVLNKNINSDGIRSLHEYSTEKNDKKRIAVLGDSFTFGDIVPTRFTYPYMLEELTGAEVLNYGMSGRGINYMYLMFYNRTLSFDPDILIMGIFVDDIRRIGKNPFLPVLSIEDERFVVGTDHIISNQELINTYKEPLIESYLLKFIIYMAHRFHKREHLFDQGIVMFDKMLDDLNMTMGGKLLVVVIDVADSMQSDIRKSNRERLLDLLERKGIVYLNDYELLKKQGTNEHFYIPVNGHFSPLGNAATAYGIKQKLESLGWIRSGDQYNNITYDDSAKHIIFFGDGTEMRVVPYEMVEAHDRYPYTPSIDPSIVNPLPLS